MLFASTELAARIERAEARLMGGAARAAMRRRQGAGCFELPIGGGVATFTAPGSPLNKVAGVGFAGPLDSAELDAVERAFAERGVPVQFELSCLGDPKIATLLTRRGYALVNFENVLGRRLPVEPQPRPHGIEIEESGDGERDAWLDLVVTGFARRHGVQSALLHARLEIASRAGCDIAVVTTQPGSKSQENVQKRGFELLYTRAILVREA
jgi:GNAT superfamily N-acetyltransferase